MTYKVEVSEQADSDLRGIFEYIAFELQSPQNAGNQLKSLEESIINLDKMPERFLKYEKEPWHSRDLRIMIVDNYLVFYIPNGKNKVVTIISVLYGGQDVDKELERYTRI